MSDYKKLLKKNKFLEVPKNIDSKINWRKENIKHSENDIYFDIVEIFNFY